MLRGLTVECLAFREICSIVHDVAAHLGLAKVITSRGDRCHPPTQSEATTDKTGRILQEALDPSS